jgi:hypothetical protein
MTLRLAEQAGHQELLGWAWELVAWWSLVARQYHRAIDATRKGRAIAPGVSSAMVQLHVQEAYATSRLGASDVTHDALSRAGSILPRLPPDDTRNHFVFDPAKLSFHAAHCNVVLGEAERAEELAARSSRRVAAAGPPASSSSVRSARPRSGVARSSMQLSRRLTRRSPRLATSTSAWWSAGSSWRPDAGCPWEPSERFAGGSGQSGAPTGMTCRARPSSGVGGCERDRAPRSLREAAEGLAQARADAWGTFDALVGSDPQRAVDRLLIDLEERIDPLVEA